MAELRFWGSLSPAERDGARQTLKQIIQERVESLVATFYGAFLPHPEASSFLTHSVVQERLSHSLQKWLLDLLDADLDDAAFARRQVHIGEVHARIKLPVHLVLEGASLIKIEVSRCVLALDIDTTRKAAAIIAIDEIIDYAMRLMSEAYVAGAREEAHTDEAFRLFALSQDISIERETQRATLMEWSQSILYSLVTNSGPLQLDLLAQSTFGLWVRHRGAVLFQGSPLLKSVEAIIARIDAEILTDIDRARGEDPSAIPRLIGTLQAAIEEIRFLLGDIFQTAAEMEGGRDPLTRALNRKFLPAVMGREMLLAKRNDTPLSIVMIDVDHFKAINDRFGHPGGDVVLRHVADLIIEAVRGSDLVFRYGGEEFLVVLVETSPAQAVALAERVRARFNGRPIAMPDQSRAEITVSAGVATFDGHPDFEYLVAEADKALYRAKTEGRNRVCVA